MGWASVFKAFLLLSVLCPLSPIGRMSSTKLQKKTKFWVRIFVFYKDIFNEEVSDERAVITGGVLGYPGEDGSLGKWLKIWYAMPHLQKYHAQLVGRFFYHTSPSPTKFSHDGSGNAYFGHSNIFGRQI